MDMVAGIVALSCDSARKLWRSATPSPAPLLDCLWRAAVQRCVIMEVREGREDESSQPSRNGDFMISISLGHTPPRTP